MSETLPEHLLLAMDGDFLPGAGMSLANTDEDVPLDKARPKEVMHWAARESLSWLASMLADDATVEVVARAMLPEGEGFLCAPWEQIGAVDRSRYLRLSSAALAALSAHLAPPDPARAGDTSGDAKGCGWCGLGAGHTTDEHLARWGNPDTTAAPVSGVAARAKEEGDG